MKRHLLEAEEIHKSYRLGKVETPVLRGLRLAVPEHGRIAITGASGSGKSTLLHILASLDPPDRGRVLFQERDLYREGEGWLCKFRNEKVGFVFQFHHLLSEFSALENVMIPLLIRGDSRSEATESARAVLERLGLREREAHRPAELSGGEQQRVAIARALVGRPELLFADEPTGNLDRAGGEVLMQLLLELQKESGTALVMVTHNESLAKRFEHRYALIDGKLSPCH